MRDNDRGREQQDGWQPPEYVSPWAPASSAGQPVPPEPGPASTGHDVPGWDSAGWAGGGASAHDTIAFNAGGPGEPAYAQHDDYGPREYPPPGYAPAGYGPAGYEQSGYDQPGYGHGGY